MGCHRSSLVVKMAGGACMFEYFGNNLNIGERNAEKVRAILAENQIRIAAEDVGGKAAGPWHSIRWMVAKLLSGARMALHTKSELFFCLLLFVCLIPVAACAENVTETAISYSGQRSPGIDSSFSSGIRFHPFRPGKRYD